MLLKKNYNYHKLFKSTFSFSTSTLCNSNSNPYNYELSSNLYEGLIKGDRFSLSRAITLVESTRLDHQAESKLLLNKILTNKNLKNTYRIGLSGSPGVGKSTFIESFGTYLTKLDYKVAVLAVDPSSTKTGGSILGDKTRMYELSRNDMAYVRPTPSRGTLGGVARNTNEAILLCEAAGYDIILVETVGVGQSETVVADMVDVFTLIVPPAGGDELQGMKKGIMEMSDIIIVNKADGDLINSATRAQTELISALKFMHPNTMGWETKVLKISSLKKEGIQEVWENLNLFNKFISNNNIKKDKRGQQQIRWMWREVTSSLLTKLSSDPKIQELTKQLESKVYDLKLPASRGSDIIINQFLNNHKIETKIINSTSSNSSNINPNLESVLFK